jgi:hypothetical protein
LVARFPGTRKIGLSVKTCSPFSTTSALPRNDRQYFVVSSFSSASGGFSAAF